MNFALKCRSIYNTLEKTVLILSILLASAFYAAPAPQAKSDPQANGGIFGRVVSAATHEPVRRADVKVYNSKDQWDELTDGEGRFRFPALAKGEYWMIVHRDGYTDRAYKTEQSDFDEHKELPLELIPQGMITGKVVDSLGQPLQGAQIQALGSDTRGGRITVREHAETNDLGEYRLSGLDPGTYRLRATYRDGQTGEFDPTPLTMATSYFGGSETAPGISVKANSVTTGIDFILNPLRPATVRGTLHTEAGVFSEKATLWIMGHTGEGGHGGVGENGKFEISDVSPGTYDISAETLDKSVTLFGMATVEVGDADVDTVEIVLKPIPTIEGEIQAEGGITTDSKLGLVVFMRTDHSTPASTGVGRPDKDRKFTVGLIPGEYLIGLDALTVSRSVQRIELDGKPVTDRKLRIDESLETKKLLIVLGPQTRP